MPYLGLYAAGSNSHGQLGIASEDDAHSFTKCSNLALEIHDTTTLSIKLCAGANHTLLFVEHDAVRELFVAGSSRRGQLGKITEENKLSFERLSVEQLLEELQLDSTEDISSKKNWQLKDVAAAWETSFFLLLLENSINDEASSTETTTTILLASGSNDFGQLGISKSLNNSNSEQTRSVLRIAGEGKKITSVHSGPRHTAVIDDDGNILVWGASRHGQLGSGATEAITYSPVILPVKASVGSDKPAIALGHQHTAIIIPGNAKEPPVLLLGNNKKGQLGGSDPKIRENASFPTIIEEEAEHDAERRRRGPLEVFANWNASFILDRGANKLYSFGNNASGQLGRESQASLGEIDAVNFAIEATTKSEQGGERKIFQVATGSEHTLAILEDSEGQRKVYGWGWNEHGNLGLGEGVLEDVRRPAVLHIPEGSQIHSVHAGNGTSWIAVIED